MRPDWDSYFFEVARVVSTRATCPRARIGAVLTKGKRIIGTGYNGVPEGEPHCPDTPEHLALDHCRAAVHAEYNALANALVPAFGATLYVVGPRRICPDCADRLRENGVTDFRWRPSPPALETVLDDVVAWQRETFPGEQVRPAVVHLFRELRELGREPTSGEEHADALMLSAAVRDRVVRSAEAHGIDLGAETARKLAICRRRTWGEPDADGVVEHVRAPDGGSRERLRTALVPIMAYLEEAARLHCQDGEGSGDRMAYVNDVPLRVGDIRALRAAMDGAL